jgi:tRNA(adenine34) deaminase
MTGRSEKYMAAALKEANKAKAAGEAPVGAVIVKDDMIISRGYNRREKSRLTASHAEMTAISKANKKLQSWRLDGCDMYVTLEPCPMCAGAIIQSRIRNLCFGAYDKKAGACGSVINMFTDGKWNHETNVEAGMLEEECSKILTGFFKDLREKK